ncbi:MAG: hypothetical protein Q8P07_06130 [bacterium]|nr:hypothetical protein [bacterium]
MPYIALKDRDRLDPLINDIYSKIRSLLSRWSNDAFDSASWEYLRYVALKVIQETSLNAAEQYQEKRAVRYWLAVDHAGIASNIAFELWDRVFAKIFPTRTFRLRIDLEIDKVHVCVVPDDRNKLDGEIGALVAEISSLAGPSGYNYDGAYNGLVNYSLTELVPLVRLSVIKILDRMFTANDVRAQIQFWFDVSRELYDKIARPYEDEQVTQKAGDVAVYKLMQDRLWKK